MGEEYHLGRAARIPSFVVVVSTRRLMNERVYTATRRCVFIGDLAPTRFVIDPLLLSRFVSLFRSTACSGTYTARRQNEEIRAITPAKPKRSTTM